MMLSTAFALFALFSTANSFIPNNPSYACTQSSTTPGARQIHCLKDESSGAGFNVTIRSAKRINVECRNAPDWIEFLPDSKLGLRHVDQLVLSGCELPEAESVGRKFGDGRLQFLEVRQLKGRVSRQRLDAFPGLDALALANNFLGKVDADLLYGQRYLTKLNLRATRIQIPASFFAKSRFLAHLDLSDNGLRDLEPGLFDGLVGLRCLNLSNNRFDFLQPKLFRGLSSLGFLDLSESRLYALPHDIFRDTVNLTSVDLRGNQFISIPGKLFSHGLDKLKFARLARNKLNITELPSKLFADLPSLKVASLQGFNARRLPEDLFHGSFGITEIDLSENELESLPADLLWDARELRKFNASSNELRALPDRFFVRANKLMRLDLSKNRIQALDRHFADGLEALLEINVEDNEIEYLHSDAFRWLGHLRIAKLARNRLNFRSYYRREMSPLQHCKRLEILDLSRNEIAEVFADWVHRHDRLRQLDLSHNELSYVGTDDLEFASDRLSLDLSHNDISVVNVSTSYLRDHSSSITINLSGNPIDCHCQVYPLQRYAADSSAFARVKLLVDDVACRDPAGLRGARLSELSDAKLECATVNGRSNLCVSEEACDCWIVPASRTLTIDCARRNLTEAPAWINSWDDLHVSLDLSGNALTRTPNMTSNGYDRVESLNLADNRLASIDENLVSSTLRHLHLERNELTSIEANLTRSLTESVVGLWLGGNPWLCDNTTSAFRGYVQRHRFAAIADYREVVCADDSREPLWEKPLELADVPELLARGIGALLFVAATFFLFVGLLVCMLVCFLHWAARS